MKESMNVIFWISAILVGDCFGSEFIYPTQSAQYIGKVAPATRPWYELDDSLKSVNAGWWGGDPDRMIQVMKEGLLGKPSLFAWSRESVKPWITKISEALYRSGDSPEITNILHQAFLVQTNLYRDIILHAYVMASPVPMTVLAETVVKNFPVEQRAKWYAEARRLSFDPSSPWDAKLIDRPSREALRFAHFLFMAKQIETDSECLRAIGNPTDPKRE
ncbi:MAG: hypothetical protein PHC30_08250 [Lentisphaeria bacterium]|nr:hypothetical protein [Lentisphaeria bacterium]